MLKKCSAVFFALLFYPISVAAQVIVEVPAGGDIQAALNDVCSQGGGTVNLAAGTYNPTKSILIQCSNIRLAGAGLNETTIDFTSVHGAGLSCPASGPSPTGIYPGAIAATPIHSQQELTGPCTVPEGAPLDNVEFRDFMVKRGTPSGLPVIGVLALWTNNAVFQNVKSDGFPVGFRADRSDNVTFANNTVTAFSTCVQFGEFGGAPLQVKPHTIGGSVHDIVCQNAAFGVDISNAVGIDVHHNALQGNQIGIQAIGGSGHSFHFNTIKGESIAGINVAQVSGSSIHHNTICQSPVGLRYAGFNSSVASWGWPAPSNENVVHHNDFHGVTTPILTVDPNFIGTDNLDFKNTEDSIICP